MNYHPHLSSDGTILTVHIPMKVTKHGCRKKIITPDNTPWSEHQTNVDNVLVKAIARAHRWKHILDSGRYATLQELADREDINLSYLSRVLRLTLLSPKIIQAILDGKQPPGLELKTLLRPFPLEWNEQETLFL